MGVVETPLHSSPQNVMNTFDLGFPPVDSLLTQLSKIEYKKHAQQFVNVSITILAWSAAIITILIAKYKEHNGNEKLQQLWQNLVLGVMISYDWILNTLVPECKAMYKDLIALKNIMMLVTV
jgi:hypothetical protein